MEYIACINPRRFAGIGRFAAVKYAPALKPKGKPRYRMTGESWQPVEVR